MIHTSIIIPAHNAAATIDLQLESIYRQSECLPFEVIVVCNRCTDNTVETALQWSEKIDIKVLEANELAGASYARNVGSNKARGEQLLFLDADDAIGEHYIAHSQQALEEKTIFCGGYPPVPYSAFTSLERALSYLEYFEYEPPREETFNPEWPVLAGGSLGIRRSLFRELGGFDPTYEPGAEDNEFGYRAYLAGYPAGSFPPATIAYRMPEKQIRSGQVMRKRAKSSALLLTTMGNWKANPITKGKLPFTMVLFTLVAGLKQVIKEQKLSRAWQERFFTNIGLLEGYIQYQVLGRKPLSQLGRGL